MVVVNGKRMEIMSWVSLMVKGKQLKNCPLRKYVLMCGIKTASCLRIGKKKVKPSIMETNGDVSRIPA
jgi:uncharacterized protein YlaI